METVKLPVHKHPLLPTNRFFPYRCSGCFSGNFERSYIYGGYRCNELGCGSVFHRECAEFLQEINHSSHPDHPLKLLLGKQYTTSDDEQSCSRCGVWFQNGYICSICGFKLDLRCAKEPAPLLILENPNLHQHPLEFFPSMMRTSECKTCDTPVLENDLGYGCRPCEFFIHEKCPEANHTSHPQHPLKLLKFEAVSDYADKKCILCENEFDDRHDHAPFLHHCDVCNFTICKWCMRNPPPVAVESPATHEHQLHLVPRRIDFTCNACGTLGDRSPYFCLQCNFMIHRQCIDLPRVININRHDHRISYTSRLGPGEEWKCKVCRKNVDGFYGAYTCVKCPSFSVHSLCATRWDVWDMIELEGMPEEEEEIAPFEVIDANTILHFSHDHNLLRINKDSHDQIQPENIVCEACRLQILSEPFYNCKECHFVLHEKCANHPRKKRHVLSNLPFTLITDSRHKISFCGICTKHFTGFRYQNICDDIMDVRCAAISDTLEHGSHPHPLYYCYEFPYKKCSRCRYETLKVYRCDGCDYILDGKCVQIPEKVMRNRYDDHPLCLSFGEKNVSGEYWCEACEAKVNPKKWFYKCNDCGTILHTFCVVGDYSYIMPGSVFPRGEEQFCRDGANICSGQTEVVSNTSICRPLCCRCNSRCKRPSIVKISEAGVDAYFCTSICS